MEDTSGFYKADKGQLLYAKNWVENPVYTLNRDTDSGITEPVDGWMWFDTEDAARLEYGIKKVVPLTRPGLSAPTV